MTDAVNNRAEIFFADLPGRISGSHGEYYSNNRYSTVSKKVVQKLYIIRGIPDEMANKRK